MEAKCACKVAVVAALCAACAMGGEWRVEVDGADVPLRTVSVTYGSTHPWRYGSVEVRGGEKVVVTAPDGEVDAFVASGPFKRIFDRDYRRDVLVLFGDAPDEHVPDRSDPSVKWFGPGEHEAGPIRLSDGETLYLAPGAIVHGSLLASGRDITVTGRGVLTGDRYGKCRGPFIFFTWYRGCTNLTVRGIVLAEPYHWTCAVGNCENALFENVKICAANVINDDSFDIYNSRNVTIRDSFMRSQDDNIALKGLGPGEHGNPRPNENVTVEDSILWTDRGNNFRIGFECNAPAFRNIVARNLVIHGFSIDCRPPEKFWANPPFLIEPSGGMPLENCLFENIRVMCNGTSNPLVVANPRKCWTFDPDAIAPEAMYTAKPVKHERCGSISNLVFRNVSIEGRRGAVLPEVYVRGAGEGAKVSDVRFENVTRFGETVEADSPGVVVGPFAERVSFGRGQECRAERLRRLFLSGDTNYVFVAAHRMDWRNHPENSLSGALSAIEMGVDILEVDPAVTRDGRFLLMHDAALERMTDGKGKVAERVAHAFAGLRLREGQGGDGAKLTDEPIATLEDVLCAARGKCLVNIDKFAGQAVALLAEIRRLGMERYVICKAAAEPALMRSEAGSVWSWIDDGTVIYMPIVSVYNNAQSFSGLLGYWMAEPRPPRAVEVCLRGSDGTAFLRERAALKSPPRLWMNVMWARLSNGHDDETSFTNPKDGWDWCLSRGATVLQTDSPARLIEHLEKSGRRNLK